MTSGRSRKPLFERRHYKAIAAVFKQVAQAQDHFLNVDPAVLLADLFEKDNPRFDRLKFYEACGAEE